VTGAISQSKLPSSLAAIARRVEVAAYSSWASRVKPYSSTHCSANTPIALPRSYASSRPSRAMWSYIIALP
jgi:hypothetical protein